MKRLTPQLIARAVAGASLEWMLTDPLAFGLTTASPLQRAICRAADGLPLADLATEPTVRAAFGDTSGLPPDRPREVCVLSGIRTAKSLIAACNAFKMAVSCDVTSLRPGEVPRVSVVSLRKDLADVIMNHLVGSVKASPLLRTFMVGDPSGDGIVLRHPSGLPVEVCVVAGARAGSSLVARWSAGCIFDEFPRMVGDEDGVVNWDDSRNAVLLRLLPGCQLWHIGSPWAPYGPAYEMVTEHHGKPSSKLVVVRAPAPAMNPVHWTPERVEQAKGEESYKTDVLAEFATPDEALFNVESLDRCIRKTPLTIPPKPGNTYFAAMDPATRGNGWTLTVGTREGGKAVVVLAHEWIGSRDEPLDPRAVLQEAAQLLAPYGLRLIHSDQAMGDALKAIGREFGLIISQWTYTEKQRAEKYMAIRTRMDAREVELPDAPHLRTDMLHVRKRLTATGYGVHLPQTSDGRHCDYAPTLMLVLTRLIPEPTEAKPAPRTDAETLRMREVFLSRFKRQEEW